jgi:GntR family transcriptional regulator of arabinose operon
MMELAKYKKLANDLRQEIKSGKYPQGSKIPSENELAREFNISRHTVLKALAILVDEGFICPKQGKGTFVSEFASSLKKQIAVIVYHSDNPYYSKILRGIEDFFNTHGISCILCNSEGNPDKENEYINRLRNSVDGFIISPVESGGNYTTGLASLSDSFAPLVLVTHIQDSRGDKLPYVIPDNSSGGFLATKHLIECGYEEIKFIAPAPRFYMETIQERFRGFRFALASAGIPYSDNLVIEMEETDPINGYEEDGYKLAKRIMKDKKGSCGFFVSGDLAAIGFLKGLRKLKANVPDEIGICGFNDIDLAGQYGIELTTIKQNMYGMGSIAAEFLFERINDNSAPVKHMLVPVELKMRKTTLQVKP